MKVKFVNPGSEYMLKRIMAFLQDGTTDFWMEPILYFYPSLDRELVKSLPFSERKDYVSQVLSTEYRKVQDTIEQKAVLYQARWDKYESQITAALSEAFDVECSMLFNDLVCNISLCPIEPRFLEDHSFDVFYLQSDKGAIGECLHELVHFVWFYVWNSIYHDSYAEYESPSLKWILSEMVVETIMGDERLSSINPYFPREQGGCVYPYFFTMEIDGRLILDTLDEMRRRHDIHDFMESAYTYCLNHEKEIREHIKRSESGAS